LIEALDVPREAVIMIGDTDHDVEVARAIGVDILLFGDGHQCPTRLVKAHPRVVLRCEKGGPVQLYQP
jgi:phosphoglycolate phosphatase